MQEFLQGTKSLNVTKQKKKEHTMVEPTGTRFRADIVGILIDFPPWIHINETFFPLFVLGIIFSVAVLLLKMFFGDVSSPEESSPEVPDGPNVWTVYKNALWIRYYYWVYGVYPRDICSYFWKSLMILGASILSIIFIPMVLVVLISFACWAVVGMASTLWLIIVGSPEFIKLLLQGITWLFFGIVDGAPYVISFSLTYKVIGVGGSIACLILFFRSNAWKVMRLWMKAKKERFCPRIRVK